MSRPVAALRVQIVLPFATVQAAEAAELQICCRKCGVKFLTCPVMTYDNAGLHTFPECCSGEVL